MESYKLHLDSSTCSIECIATDKHIYLGKKTIQMLASLPSPIIPLFDAPLDKSLALAFFFVCFLIPIFEAAIYGRLHVGAE